jgi:RNA-directed DNA polymerase
MRIDRRIAVGYADLTSFRAACALLARSVLGAIRQRLAECGLDLHSENTRIVYCKDATRRRCHENVAFDFLGYTFQPRRARNRQGKNFVSFLPVVSAKAAKGIRQTVRAWRIASIRNNQRLEDLAKLIDPVVRGWMNC